MDEANDGTVLAFPVGYFGRRDVALLHQWLEAARPYGFSAMRIAAPSDGGAGDAGEEVTGVSLYKYENDWPSWRILRRGAGYAVWQRLEQRMLGVYPRLADALAEICPDCVVAGNEDAPMPRGALVTQLRPPRRAG
ncbi:MAG TPA: hypothetical protein VMI52_07150 [Acetobacteraceae bacterium]|nr:hypothetical protein [Acetobacteraceae bacterium]